MKVFGEGYAIWKSENLLYHLVLKSTQRGRFHRHDDDCSITLWWNGLNLIHDSGLLYYQEKDEQRIHVRSPGDILVSNSPASNQSETHLAKKHAEQT